MLSFEKLEQIKRSVTLARRTISPITRTGTHSRRTEAEAGPRRRRPSSDVPAPPAPKATRPRPTALAPELARRDRPSSASPDAARSTKRPRAMLAQLLGKHGLGARVLALWGRVPRRASTRSTSRASAMVCISYLDLGGSPSHLHYLMRRSAAKDQGYSDPGRDLAQ